MSTLRRGLEWSFEQSRVRRSVVVLCRGEGLHRGVATVHGMENVAFCFVFLFHYSEYLSIGLMRTLKVYERVHSCL